MTDVRPDLPDVDDLLAERDALHGWLARLEASGAAAPDAVRERVRRDYQGRLDTVTESLRGHAAVLDDRLAADRAEETELLSRAGAAREALAEAELRHMVGEYDGTTYEAARVRHTSDLEAFELSLRAVAERIDRLEGIQAQVSSAPGDRVVAEPRPTAPEVADAPPIVADEPEPSIASLAPDPEPEPPATPAQEPELEPEPVNDTDAAFLSVFDDFELAPPPSSAGPTPPAIPIEAAPLSFTPRGPGAVPPPPIGMPGVEPPRFTPPPAAPKPPAAPPLVDPSPMFVGGMVPQPDDLPDADEQEPVAKTVRCGECGALNRPLEWYCEKCGAELTAV